MPSSHFELRIACSSLAITVLATVPSLAAAAGDAAGGLVSDQAAAGAAPAERGNASFYSKRLAGHRTASGERYDPAALTAAHRTLPLGTQVRVVNAKNDRSVVVTVNDRGPVPKNRMMDLSSAAADQLGMKQSGVARVRTEVVGRRGDAAKTE